MSYRRILSVVTEHTASAVACRYGISLAAEVLLAALIIETSAGNSLFACAPIGADVWLLLIPFAVLPLATDEIRKYFGSRA